MRVKGTLADYAGEVAGAGHDAPHRPHGAAATRRPRPTCASRCTTPCTPTAARDGGSTCSLDTTLDALIPGAVVEGQRTMLQLGQVRVVDGGPDDDVATEPNTVFLRQGVFVP